MAKEFSAAGRITLVSGKVENVNKRTLLLLLHNTL